MFDDEMRVFSIPGFSDPVSALTHLAGSVVFAVLGFFLVLKGRQADRAGWNAGMTALAVFAFAAVAQLAVSGAYHILQPGLRPRLVLQQLDHAAIFVLIAASFVPVHVILFKGWRRWLILLVMVALAAIGITFKLLYFDRLPEIAGLALYLGMGWAGVYSGYALCRRHGWAFIRPLAWEGIAYTAGGALEFLRGPVLFDGIVGPHELFHLAVLTGLGFHFHFLFSIAGRRQEVFSAAATPSLSPYRAAGLPRAP